MSTFICTECGAPFTGTLRGASDAAFKHSAEHAPDLAQKPGAHGPGNSLETLGRFSSNGLPTENRFRASEAVAR